ncbi:MAG TPA: MFS transporter [Dehalococcoidia bacterium]
MAAGSALGYTGAMRPVPLDFGNEPPPPLEPPLAGRDSLRTNLRFRRFSVARLLSHTGQNAALFALLVLVVNRTGSSIHSSLLVLSYIVPSVLAGPAAGAVVDALPRRAVLILTNLARAGVCLGYLLSDRGPLAVYLTAMGLAVVSQFSSPAESAAVPAMVRREQLVGANAVLNFIGTAAQVLGMVILAPLVLKLSTDAVLFSFLTGLFLLAALFSFGIPGLGDRADAGAARRAVALRAAFREAWAALRADRAAYTAMVQVVLTNASLPVLVALVPMYISDIVGLAAENAVYVFAPAALGVLLGLRLVPALARRAGTPALVSAGFALFVAGLAALAFNPELVRLAASADLVPLGPDRLVYSPLTLTAVLAFPLGFAYSVVLVAARTVLYERTPAAVHGRIFAVQGMLGALGSMAPLVLTGALAYLFGTRVVLLLVAVANVTAAVYAGAGFGRAAGRGPLAAPAPAAAGRPRRALTRRRGRG